MLVVAMLEPLGISKVMYLVILVIVYNRERKIKEKLIKNNLSIR